MIEHNWRYVAKIVRIVDGDTYDLDIDTGFATHRYETVRLLSSTGGVNTPEIHSTDLEEKRRGVLAMMRVVKLLPVGTVVCVKTQMDHKDGFRRYLAEIIMNDGTNIGDLLLAEGLASVWSK